jgi:integral membrane protein (TIGR01906 family)
MKILYAGLTWVSALLVPIAFIFIGILFLLSPLFLKLEYRMPGFPLDTYGFSTEDRLHWAGLAQQYLRNDAGVEFLGDLKFSNGETLYNSRELSHLQDVKGVAKIGLVLGYSSWVVLIVLTLLSLRRFKYLDPYLVKGLRLGSWITIGILSLVAVFAITSFWNFFTFFHELFFKGDSWLFYYSDTLIRLFPIRFWQDAFLMVGIFALGCSLLILIFLKQPTSDRV